MFPTVVLEKCWFCNFHAVFGHFAQIVPTGGTLMGTPDIRDYLFSTYAAFFKKLMFFTQCAYQEVEIIVF